jgi:hydroxymethylbilane synthase
MTQTIRLGTRGSALARWQTEHVWSLLQAAWPDLKAEIQVITTQGDRLADTPLPLIGGKGVFTAELEAALRGGNIDLAVHSLKDLPTETPEGLIVGAIPERANPADVLVSRRNYTLGTLPKGAAVGAGSRRRSAQLLHWRPDLRILDIRGNVDTRVRKALDANGPYDAIVLAHAGLERLGQLHVVSQVLSFEQMLPAPGQGALAVQCRDEAPLLALLMPIRHLETTIAVSAERAFLSGLGGGCAAPIAAYAAQEPPGEIRLRGRVTAPDGSAQIDVSATIPENTMETAQRVGVELAQEALSQGATAFVEAEE